MCVIVYKPKGVAMPPLETLRACWERNPDGAGLMFPAGGRVRWKKGCMEWEAFERALRPVAELRDSRELPVALHFRIATHGGVKPGCCHPFPVCKDYGRMREAEGSCEVGFMHNGTLAGLETRAGVSDSMAFASGVLSPLRAMCGDLVSDGRAARLLAASTQGSRFLLMDGAGGVAVFGRWFAEDGVLYSNLNHLAVQREAPRWGEGSQGRLFDAFMGFDPEPADLAQLGLFPACAGCPLLAECAEYLPYCADEAQAAEEAEAMAP